MKTVSLIATIVLSLAIHSFAIPLISDSSHYAASGIKDGAWESYYENGKVQTKGAYRKGKLEGVYETYHENGKIKCKGAYNNGKNRVSLNIITIMIKLGQKLHIVMMMRKGCMRNIIKMVS